MNKRNLNLQKYGISGKRYKELCGFCEQYPEWKEELKSYPFIKGHGYSDMPSNPNMDGNPTEKDAIRLEKLLSRCMLIEETAKEADKELWDFIIKSVCYSVPIAYLQTQENMCVSRAAFFDRRRYFFYLLDRNKE